MTLEAKSLNDLWTANGWGIVGTISGAIGTLLGGLGLWISFHTFKYTQPQISIEILGLSYSKILLLFIDTINDLVEKKEVASRPNAPDPHSPDSASYRFVLTVNIRNEHGGSGSIQKPKLIFKDRCGKVLYTADPITEKILPNMGVAQGLRVEGANYKLNGGDRLDNQRIEYSINSPEFRNRLIVDKLMFKYFIGYCDNSGKYHEKGIDSKKIKAV